MEDVTETLTYFVALPLVPKNLTPDSVIIVRPTFSFFDQLNRTFHAKAERKESE